MARFKIISKDGSTIRYEGKPKYVGTYLRPSYLEFSEIASPTPIEWEIGDYIDYPRTGLRYRLYSIPQPTKNARKGSHGKAFTYSTVQFHAATKELEIALFKDVVFADNNIHFSTTPGVDTFEDVYGIANRIQACMDDIFPGKWEIRVADFDPATDSEIIENITTAKSFALTSGTCLDALSKIYALWQEVGWIHAFDSVSGKDIITIGYSSKRIDENTTDAYVYGKGNGLTAIKSRQANKEEFATRLYVYGSERNLPARYYNDKDILNAESVDIHNLMIPLYEWGVTDGKPDARKAYIENADAVAKYGVIPRIHYFDSEEAGADVYPSLERTTIGLVRRVLAEMGETKYSPRLEEYPDDSERVDCVKTVLGLPNDDGVLNRNGDAYDVTRDVTIPESTITKTVIPMAGNYELVSEHVLYQHRIAANFPYGEITATPSLQCIVPDADFSSVTALITLGDALDVSTLREGKSVSVQGKKNADSGNWEIDFAEVTAKFDKTVHNGGFYVMYYVTVTATKNETSEPKTIDISFLSGSLRLNIKEILAKTFSLRLKQLGFDIDERAALGAGKTISMKSGMCQGRNFVISACKYNVTYDAWDLTLIRQQDDTLGMLFPNTSYPINEEDRFVLLDIAMPELYVRVAMERLYSEGQALLSRVSKIRNNYEPIIDAKVMQESGRTIREGMFMQINDEDVIDGKTEYILIDTLNISEGEAAIPTCTVSLKEKKKVSYKGTPSATSSSNVRPATESKEADIDLSGYATKDQVKALEYLKDLFYKTEDGESVGTRYNLFSEKEVSSNGLNAGDGNGGTGGGLISSVLRKEKFGLVTSDDLNTTFNAFAIDSLHKRIKSLEEAEVEVDLTGYATESWVLARNYITVAALSPYLKTADANSTFATLVALNALAGNVDSLGGDISTLSSNLNTLKGRFDALDDALNDDVSGKINTWNEIVDFLDEYNGSEDLATILSGMNADIALRLKTADFDAWKTDVYSPLATRVSTAEGNISTHTTQISGLTTRMGSAETNISTNAKGIADNKTAIATNKSNISANATAITNLGKRVTANESNIAEILKWFAVDSDGNLYTTYNLYSTKEISANGLSVGSGGGGGLISQVFGITAFGTIASESNSATFNAYAIDSLYKRIVSLEGKATAVSFVPALTSGKQIGTLSIDGVSTVLYGVDAYSKAEADARYLKLTGGEVNELPNIVRSNSSIVLGVENKYVNYTAIRFKGGNGNAAYLIYSGTGDTWKVSNVDWLRESILLHSNNYSEYALPISGGTIRGSGDYASTPITIKSDNSSYVGIAFSAGSNHNNGGAVRYYSGLDGVGLLNRATDAEIAVSDVAYFTTDAGTTKYPLLHSNNYSQYALPLTGGTISGSGSGILTINRTSGTPLISFQANGTNVGFLGIDTVSRPCFVDPVYYETSYLIHSGNYNSYAPKLDGTGASGTWGIDVSGTAASLQNHVVFGLVSDSAEKWKQFAKIELSGRFSERSATFQLRIPSSSISVGASCEVYVMMYQQAAMGSAPQYSVQTNCDDRKIKIAAILNYNSTSSSITLYAYCPHAYTKITVSTLSRYGSDVSIGSEMLSELPSGTQIAIEKMGTSYSTTKLATARTIWGQSFDGSGNVSGNIQGGKANFTIYGYNSTLASNVNILTHDNNKSLWLGYGMNAEGNATIIAGTGIEFRYGTSRGIAAFINSSGNVTIGSSDLAGTSAKLYVDGHISCNGNLVAKSSAFAISAYNSNTNAGVNVLDFSSSNKQLWYGYGMNAEGYYTMIGGNVVALRYGASRNYGLYLNASGNVGIGTTSPAYKLDVNGSVGIGSSGASDLYLRRANGFSYITATSHLALSTGGDAANVALGLTSDKNATFYGNLEVKGTTTLKSLTSIEGNLSAWGASFNGDVKVQRPGSSAEYFNIEVRDVSVNYKGYDNSDGYVYHRFYSNDTILLNLNGKDNIAYFTGGLSTVGAVTMSSTLSVDSSLNVGTVINVGSNIMPKTNETSYLGSTSLRFLAVCAKVADFSGAVSMGSTLSVTGATTLNSTLLVAGEITAASTIKANSVICATTRLRVNATNNMNVFGFIDAALYGTTNNVSTVHIGSCYGGASTITNTGEYPNGVSMTAISIYRGVVGIGKKFSDSELRAAYGEGVSLTTSGGLTSTGLITASSGVKVASGQALTFLDASGKEHKLTYDSTAGAFKFDGNILVLGDGQFNAIN